MSTFPVTNKSRPLSKRKENRLRSSPPSEPSLSRGHTYASAPLACPIATLRQYSLSSARLAGSRSCLHVGDSIQSHEASESSLSEVASSKVSYTSWMRRVALASPKLEKVATESFENLEMHPCEVDRYQNSELPQIRTETPHISDSTADWPR